MLRVCIFEHVPFEELGSIESWLKGKNAQVDFCRVYAKDPLPIIEKYELFIFLGGSMSANDERHYPWLVEEKTYIRELVALNKAVIGICLGAQIIADAMGGRVYHNYTNEIGWFDVHLNPEAGNPLQLPETMTVFHWHGETMELPPQAKLLASSQQCHNQVYLLNERVLGTLCHFEATRESTYSTLLHCMDELSGETGSFVQDSEEIQSQSDEHYEQMTEWMFRILDFVTRSLDDATN